MGEKQCLHMNIKKHTIKTECGIIGLEYLRCLLWGNNNTTKGNSEIVKRFGEDACFTLNNMR